MAQYSIEIKGLNNDVLKSVVAIHNREYKTKFTAKTYLEWILNRWFENKIEHKETNPRQKVSI